METIKVKLSAKHLSLITAKFTQADVKEALTSSKLLVGAEFEFKVKDLDKYGSGWTDSVTKFIRLSIGIVPVRPIFNLLVTSILLNSTSDVVDIF